MTIDPRVSELIDAGRLTHAIVPSIYGGKILPFPMALWTPDTVQALARAMHRISLEGGKLIFSDGFRTIEGQRAAYEDWMSGKKKAYSPPPEVGSMHMAGRAFDFDPMATGSLNQELIWEILQQYGFSMITGEKGVGDPNRVDVSEEWHAEFRGIFGEVYDKLRAAGDGGAYGKMCRAAIEALYDPVGLAAPHLDPLDSATSIRG